jgi:hypothetical protein
MANAQAAAENSVRVERISASIKCLQFHGFRDKRESAIGLNEAIGVPSGLDELFEA